MKNLNKYQVLFIFAIFQTVMSTAFARTEACISSYEKTSDIYNFAVKNISKRQPDVWKEMLEKALVQIKKCNEPSDILVKSSGYLSASQASEMLENYSESRTFAKLCIDSNMFNSLCYVQLVGSNYALGNTKEAKAALIQGMRVVRGVSEKSEQAIFDSSRKLQDETDYFKKQYLMLDIRSMKADLKTNEVAREQLEQWQTLLEGKN
jgi:hypothetical protein